MYKLSLLVDRIRRTRGLPARKQLDKPFHVILAEVEIEAPFVERWLGDLAASYSPPDLRFGGVNSLSAQFVD